MITPLLNVLITVIIWWCRKKHFLVFVVLFVFLHFCTVKKSGPVLWVPRTAFKKKKKKWIQSTTAVFTPTCRWRSLHTPRHDDVPDGTSSLMMKLRWRAKCLLWEVYCNGSLAVTARHEKLAQSAAAAGSNTALLCFNLSALNTASDPTFPSIYSTQPQIKLASRIWQCIV